jgi:chromosome segregation ATPase
MIYIFLVINPSSETWVAFWDALFSNAGTIITALASALIAIFMFRHNTKLGKIDTKMDSVEQKVNGITEKRIEKEEEIAKAKIEAAEIKGKLEGIKDAELKEAWKKLPPTK